MHYKNINMYDLLNDAQDKTLICFGAGQYLKNACSAFSDISFFSKIDFIVDNNPGLKSFAFEGKEKPVYSINSCLQHMEKEPMILITMLDCFSVIDQLDSIHELDNCDCFLYAFVKSTVKPYRLRKNRALREPLRIPRTIHYCWFGGAPLCDVFSKNIETWKKNCPGYEIIRWDERNYDYTKNRFMNEAYKQKKWAFVSDCARLDIIDQYGGIYLDTDVRIVRNFDDLLCDEAFYGFVKDGNLVNNGHGFGAVAGFPLIQEQLEMYKDMEFINTDGSLNITPGPCYQTGFLCVKGLLLNNSLQSIQGMKIYPSDVFDPFDHITEILAATENTYAIHYYTGTWKDEGWQHERTKMIQKYKDLAKMFHVRQ